MSITIELPSGEQLPYESTNLIIGSDIACDIFIEHEDVHEQHCRIRKMAGRWIVESMGDWEIRAGLLDPGLKAWIQPTDELYLTPVGPVLIFEPLPHPVGYDPLAKKAIAPKKRAKATPKAAAAPVEKQQPARPAPAVASSGEVDWLCIINDQGHGPVSQSELKRLASSGQLKPSDLVWRVGLADWTPAAEVAELMLSGESAAGGSPNHHDAQSRLDHLLPGAASERASAAEFTPPEAPSRSFLAGLFARANATERLAVKQAEYETLTSVTLPAAYQELGESNFEHGYFKDAFHAQFHKIQTLRAELKQLSTKSHVEAGGGGEMTAMISAAKDAADRRKLVHQREQALMALGKAAYDNYGEQAGIAKLVSNITACLEHIESLDREITKLSESGGGIILTPVHYAIGAVAGVLLLIFLVIGISLAVNRPERNPVPESTEAAVDGSVAEAALDS
jgi:hypothetical protein